MSGRTEEQAPEEAKRILIVEDQRLIAADLEATLRKLGYLVVGSVASGEEAVAKAAEIAPQLVLMDIRLKGKMSGIEAAQIIRDRHGVPVVFLTAYADEETILRAKTTTPFGYLVKPFNERELRATIEIAFFTHRMDRQLTEERVRREAAEEFKLLVEGVSDYAIIMLDTQGGIITWNAGAERMKGFRAEEIIGKHFSVLYTAEARQAHHPERDLETAQREGRYQEEGWRVRKDGSRFWANIVLSPAYNAGGELRGFAKVTRDLTERKQAEEKREKLVRDLREALKARDEFMQIASHELKTPLTPLMLQLGGLSRALHKTGLQNELLTTRLESISRQTERLSRLIDSLLDVSRITAGRLALQIEDVDMAEVAREVGQRFQREATSAGSALQIHADGQVMGRWDRLRVEQILSNLISNAIKYGAGHAVEVDVQHSDGRVRVVVSDHGIGIHKEALSRIFDRFERAVSSREYGGLGLGLFIARQIAEAHGGSIAADSEVGKGSVFAVVLPREPPPPKPDAEAPATEEGH
jgi:PAS domain S-box-containing protein